MRGNKEMSSIASRVSKRHIAVRSLGAHVYALLQVQHGGKRVHDRCDALATCQQIDRDAHK